MTAHPTAILRFDPFGEEALEQRSRTDMHLDDSLIPTQVGLAAREEAEKATGDQRTTNHVWKNLPWPSKTWHWALLLLL